MKKEAKLDKFGRIVLPKSVRDAYHLEPGDVMQIRESGEQIVLEPARHTGGLREKDGLLVYSGEAEGDLEKAVDAQRRRRTASVADKGARNR